MNAEGAGLLHYGLISLVILAGFYGIFSQKHLVKKLAAWGVLQAGIILLFWSLAEKIGTSPSLNPLPLALAFGVLGVSIIVGAILALYVWSLFRETGKSDEDSIHRKLS